MASTEITSIQRWHKVRIENSHLRMIGRGRITSLDIAETYSLYSIDQQFLVGKGSTIVMNSPSDELYQLYSLKSFSDFYNVNSTESNFVNYDELGAAGSETDNKFRIREGGFFKIRYTDASNKVKFGELKGFFHLMGDTHFGTDIYARPKQSAATGNHIPDGGSDYFNTGDGGFVSYVAAANNFNVNGGTDGDLVQVEYENHVPGLTKDDSEYYRIWRFGGISHEVDAVLNAIADNSDNDYLTVTVDVKLPGWRDAGNYYRFVRKGDAASNYYTLINYGFDVLTFNAANYQDADGGVPNVYVSEEEPDSHEWMCFNGTNNSMGLSVEDVNDGTNAIEDNPNLNFGLVLKPSSGFEAGSPLIICPEANNYLANQTFGCGDVKETPTLSFELTFSNNLRVTRTNDPIIVPMVQCEMASVLDEHGDPVLDEHGDPVLEERVVDTVNIVITVATSADITLGSRWKMYAIMDGSNTRTEEILKVEIPKFEVYTSGQEAKFYLKKAKFTPRTALVWDGSAYEPSSSIAVAYNTHTSNFDINKFGLTLLPVKSTISSDTWRFITEHELDAAPGSGENLPASEFKIGENGGRSPVSMDLNLYYNPSYNIESYTGNKPIPMGTVVYTLEFDNFAAGDENHIGTSTITVDIYRKGLPRIFYVDGVNGEDVLESGRGDYPNYAAKSVGFILNRGVFLPGDKIYVVNTVTIAKETTWDGSAYQNNVTIERYPGGHDLSDATDAIPVAQFDNTAFTGVMIDVKDELSMNGVIVDGHMNNDSGTGTSNAVAAEAPMFMVENGGQLSLGNATTLQNNNNTSGNGGAVHVNYGGTLRMKRNDVIQISIVTFGVLEVARIEMTPDYFMLIDKVGKQYVKSPYNEVSFLRDGNVDFYTLQAYFWDEQTSNYSGWERKDFVSVGGKSLPTKHSITIPTSKKTIKADLTLSNLTTDSEWEKRTQVSSRYKEVSVDELISRIMSLSL